MPVRSYATPLELLRRHAGDDATISGYEQSLARVREAIRSVKLTEDETYSGEVRQRIRSLQELRDRAAVAWMEFEQRFGDPTDLHEALLVERRDVYDEAQRFYERSDSGEQLSSSDEGQWRSFLDLVDSYDQFLTLTREAHDMTTPRSDQTDPRAIDFLGRAVGRSVGYDGNPDAQVLARGESLVGWMRARSALEGGNAGVPADRSDEGVSLVRLLRGVSTGDWSRSQAELRALGTTTGAGGGYLVPSFLSAQLIDLARNEAQVFNAGATLVPMQAAEVTVPRLETAPTATWHQENTEDISDGGMTFGAVKLASRTLTCLVKVSRELLEDGNDPAGIVEAETARSMALEVDRVALRGGASLAEPTGVINTSGINTTTFSGANGGTPEDYDFLVDAFQVLAGQNFTPTGVILAPRTETTIAKFKDTTGQPLRAPDVVAAVPRYSTNQIGTAYTVGSSNDCSEVFVADWRHLFIGIRTNATTLVLQERYSDALQVGFLVYLRGDVMLSRAAAFNYIKGIRA